MTILLLSESVFDHVGANSWTDGFPVVVKPISRYAATNIADVLDVHGITRFLSI